ncbi:hypothetical protein OXX79_004753 [Metschnikowia pulcherrima]
MILTNATIITVNANFDVIENGAIVIHADTIAAVGPANEIVPNFPHEEIVNLKGQIVMPGLISLHVHLAQSLLRTAADDLALIEWLCHRVWRMQGNFTEEDGYVAAQLTIAKC